MNIGVTVIKNIDATSRDYSLFGLGNDIGFKMFKRSLGNPNIKKGLETPWQQDRTTYSFIYFLI